MLKQTAAQHSPIVTLTLAFLLTGLFGCSKGSAGEQAASAPKTAPAAATAPTPPPAGAPPATTPAPGAPQTLGTPPAAKPAAPPLDTAKLPAVVAKVNGTDIKKADLVKEADQLQGQLTQMNRPPEAMDIGFYRQVLDGVVARILLQQEAKAQGITVTDDDVKGQIASLRGRFPSQAEFDKALADQGMKESDLIARAKDAFQVQKLIETKILANLTISDEAAKAFYDQNQDKMQRPEQVHVRHILIRADKTAPEADRKKAKEKAQGLLDQIKKGGDFAKLATDNSDDPGSKARGGDLNWVSKGQTVEPFEKAAFALAKPNDLSPVVESDFGYHVIQLIEKRPAGVVPFAEAKERIANFLKQKQSQEKVQARIQELRTKGKVEIFI